MPRPTTRRPDRQRLIALVATFAFVATASIASFATVSSAQSGDDFTSYASQLNLSSEHADVFRLYWAFFDRQPDSDGAAYWVAEYDRCATLFDIAWSFGNSKEFTDTYGQPTDAGFVTLVYRNVMDREADREGAGYWGREIASGRVDREGVMLYFALSDEFRGAHPLPSDGRPYAGCVPPTPPPPPPPTPPSPPSSPDAYYANCTAARRAGAAPLRAGDPGYRSGLDRDSDGIACE